MLGERLTAARWVVSLDDPALTPIFQQAPEKIGRYARTRDIEDLGGVAELEKLPRPPTLFSLSPMLVKFQHLEGDTAAMFALHCGDMKNAPASFADWEETHGVKSLKQSAVDAIPRGIVRELGELVEQFATANGVDTPFGSPVGWSERMSRRAAIAVIDADAGEIAK